MKKTLSALLVGSMLVFPVPALASEDTDTINSLSFETLEEVMKENSPMILNMGDSISDASSKISDSKKKLEDSLTPIDGMVSSYNLLIADADTKAKSSNLDPDLVAFYKSLSQYYQSIVGNLMANKASLQAQIDGLEDQQSDMWKSWLQVDQGKDQTIWGAQTLYLSYYNLYDQKDNLSNNLNLLQKQLSVLKLQESLGMVTATQVAEVESQIKDLQMGLDQLNKGLEGIKGQLNVFLGQDYDTPLQLKEPVSLAQSKIRAMDYEGDLEDALVQSYDVRLEDNSNKREDAERSFTLAFHNAYQDVQDKLKTLDLESYKLTNEKTKYDQAVLKNSLGLMSNLEFEGARSKYTTQVNKVDTAEEDLLKAYTAYDWMKQGLTISTTASGSSQSTGAAGAPAGMSF